MMLLTKANQAALPPIGSTSEQEDPIVQVKFFNPCGASTWFATEFDGEDSFFGWCDLFGDESCAELGYFSLSEMQSYRGTFGLGIERDLHFRPCPLSEAKARLYGRRAPAASVA